jgi:hypothetical protein
MGGTRTTTGRAEVLDLWSPEYRTPEYQRWAIDSLRAEFGHPVQPMGMYQVEGTDPRSSLGRAIELERFGDSFDNDADLLRDLYGTFEEAGNTQLLCVVDHEAGRPAGVIRTVRNTARDGCRILNDLQKHGDNGWGLTWEEILERSDFEARVPEDIIDIPTIAVGKAYAGSSRADSVSKALFAAVLQHAIRSDAVTWVCSLDRIPYILVQAWGIDVMHEFDGVPGQPYYGAADTVPLWCNFRPYERNLAVIDPDRHARLMHNRGLEDYFFGWPDERVIDLRDHAPSTDHTGADVVEEESQAAAGR